MTLREFLRERDIPMDAAAILAGVDVATISRIASGKSRPRPQTVLRLAQVFDMSARRMQGMCSESWAVAHAAEQGSGNAA